MQPSPHATALIVDDDPITRAVIVEKLRALGVGAVLEARDGVAAQELLRGRHDIDIVLTDIVMPRLDGLGLVAWAREHRPDAVFVILSVLDRFDKAVEAIRLGAFDFLAKPIRDEELEVSVRNALEHCRLLRERGRLHDELQTANAALLDKVDELEHKSELMLRDLQRAEVIQRALLPQRPPSLERYSVRALYRPGRFVGGDLYDVIRIGNCLVFYVADSTGHGVTAAMLSVLFKQQLHVADDGGNWRSPAEVLKDANAAIADAVDAPGLFITAVYGALDLTTGDVALTSAGHPPVLHRAQDGQLRSIGRNSPALGLSSKAVFREEHFRLEPGDRLLLYTDGVLGTDTGGSNSRFAALMQQGATTSNELAAVIADDQTLDEDEIDDVTLLLIDAAAGVSWFDNGASGEAFELTTRAQTGDDVLFYGETDGAQVLALRGRATWRHGDAFYQAACSILDEHHPLIIDLTGCEYLDSTVLGTIHELVSLGRVAIQAVQPPVHALFEELGMQRVLAAITDAVVVPELYPLKSGSGAASKQRILHAHEALAELSDANRARFKGVIDTMRAADDPWPRPR